VSTERQADSSRPAYCGRFAPSPTGDLHLGSAATALVTWLAARAAGGRLVLRVEDIDTPRVVPGAEARQLDDLRWLGLDWDEGPDVGGPRGPYRQSERTDRYEVVLAALERRGLTFRCDCSRREIAEVASAPHDEDGPRYPGTCRARRDAATSPAWRRPPAVRLAVPPGEVVVDDAVQGRFVQDVAARVGDFVLRRGDGVWAYQFAVVVDDVAMGVTEVVRGADLLASAPRQVLLAGLLGAAVPTFVHAPVVLAPDGTRLAKRDGAATVRELRQAGACAPALIGGLAAMLGLRPDAAPVAPRALVRDFSPTSLAGRAAVRLPPGVVHAPA
jgi:glutamyl-tRNA synthetase